MQPILILWQNAWIMTEQGVSDFIFSVPKKDDYINTEKKSHMQAKQKPQNHQTTLILVILFETEDTVAAAV